VSAAIDLACSVSVELDRLCSAGGARLVFVYLPPPTRGQPHHFVGERDAMLAEAGLADLELGVSDRIADAWLGSSRSVDSPFSTCGRTFAAPSSSCTGAPTTTSTWPAIA
jgi:hypothetical protein